MAERKLRHPRNAKGRYYVDTTCVHCKLCQDLAPEHFSQNDERDGFVQRQPTGEKEEAVCREAREHCPVSAIGEDGESGA
jgi:ferredoxin